jgi:ATP-binding cassette, subfamily B, bacterial
MKEKEQKLQVVDYHHHHLESSGLSSRSDLHPGLRLRLPEIRRKRVPPLLQMTEVECGLTCLAMVLSYYGRQTSVSELRARFGGGRDGFSALGIVKAARTFGMRVRAISLQGSEFSHVTLPAIVHWQFNHFLVVERWSPKAVMVVDPAGGRKKLTCEEFDRGFTGIVIIMEPGVNFDRQSIPSPVSLRMLVKQAVRQAPGAIFQVLAASMLLQIFGLALPLLNKLVLDQIVPLKLMGVMDVLGLGLLMIMLSQGITTLLREWLLVYLRARIDIHIMLGFFEHLLSLPYGFFQQRSNGDLLARMGSNTVIRDMLSNQMISTFLDSTMVIAYLFILLWQSLPFGLLTLAIGSLQIFVLLVTYRPICEVANQELASQGKAQGYMSEALTGIATIKAAGAEDRAQERWSNLFFEQLNLSVRHGYLSAVISTIMLVLRSMAPLALLWIGTMQVLQGSLSPGSMVALNVLATSFLAPLASLVSGGQQLQLVHAHLGRLADVITSEPEQNVQKVLLPPKLSGHIYLENVSFQYAPDIPKVLRSISLTIYPGQKVAIVGKTGSGKSTLGKLLLGLHIPTEGHIYYDGIPLANLHYQEVRRQFGVVLQDASIFSGTILHNITFNYPQMSREQAIRAAQIAAIHEDIVNMPMGYETYVAEGGSALSGGQRQRLALARALAHVPAILLLDEATSSLDVITEQKVSLNLQALSCTQIIIAHRLSTIRNADVILVLDEGTIVEYGTHEDLLRYNGYYARLIQQQLEKQERKSGLHRISWLR